MPQLAVAVIHVLAALAAALPSPSQEPGGTAAPTVALEGRVVDARGEPVALAEITVTSSQQREVVLAKGSCDGDGAFRIARIASAGRLRVVAHRDGYARVGVLAVDDGRPLRIELSDAATVQGVVRDRAGKPVAGAQVHATSIFVPRPPVEADARADENGAFTMRDVPLGMVHFAALVPGQGIAELRQWIRGEASIELSPVAGAATTTLQVAIEGIPPEALGAVSTSITFGSRTGCVVRLPPPWDSPVFDSEGRFELRHVPDMALMVRLHAVGFVLSPAETQLKAGAGPHRVLVHAARLPRCLVRVCDREGSPVAGVRCEMGSGEDASTAISGTDGMVTFTTPAVAGSTVSVMTRDQRWVGTARDVFDPARPLELRVEPSCHVRGRVVQPDGRPAPFAAVVLRKADADPRTKMLLPVRLAAADRDGNFEVSGLRYQPERLCVAVAGECGAGTSEPITLAASGDPVTVPPVRLQAPATITGTVTDAQGRAPGVCVVIVGSEFGVLGAGGKNALTDRNGRFRIVGVVPGATAIDITAIDSSVKRRRVVEPFEVEAGKQYAFELEYGQ